MAATCERAAGGEGGSEQNEYFQKLAADMAAEMGAMEADLRLTEEALVGRIELAQAEENRQRSLEVQRRAQQMVRFVTAELRTAAAQEDKAFKVRAAPPPGGVTRPKPFKLSSARDPNRKKRLQAEAERRELSECESLVGIGTGEEQGEGEGLVLASPR